MLNFFQKENPNEDLGFRKTIGSKGTTTLRHSASKDIRNKPFGDYLLVRKLAHGGMAEVFLAKRLADPDAGPLVLKCILPELADDPQFLAMFVNEAQLAAQMDHTNIVRVFDFGEHEGRLFMAMEFVEGVDCWRFARCLYPWGEDHAAVAILIVTQVLRALEYVHGLTDVNGNPLRVVHRDLSPTNIYLSTRGAVKLGDFGIARIDSHRYRQVAVIPKGKFGYIAPELIEGRPIDQRADIFSVGVVLAELLIGKKMFTGASQLSVMLEIQEGRLETLDQNTDKVEPGLLQILHNALALCPDERFSDAREFREALQVYMEMQNRLASPAQLAIYVSEAVNIIERNSLNPPTPVTAAASPNTAVTAPAPPPAPPQTTPVCVTEPTQNELRATAYENDDAENTPVTRESSHFVQEWRYTAQLDDGRTVGPTSYAHIIELICSDCIGPTTLVCAGKGTFRPAESFPELARHLPAYTPNTEAQDVQIPNKRGALHVHPAPRIILELSCSQATGMLTCRHRTFRKEVYFREGQIVYVASNEPKELLGEFLVQRNVIDRAELEIALALLPKFSGHLGDTLIALGMMSAVDLFKHIGQQISTRYEDLLNWNRGSYEFYDGTACRTDVLEVRIDPFETVRERLIGAAADLDSDEILAGARNATITKGRLFGRILDGLGLPATLRESIERERTPFSIAQRLRENPSEKARLELAQALFIAFETGIWLLSGPTPSWRSSNPA